MKRAVLHILSDGPGSIRCQIQGINKSQGKAREGHKPANIKKKKREEMECSGPIWSS